VIASVRGTVAAVRLDAAVVEVGGVGLLVHATPGTLAGLRTGAEGRLATSMVVREDSLTLYGFADTDERDVFDTLLTVSGIGPRLALAMLAVHTPDGLRAAVAAQDLTALTRVPGIGRKGAQRLVLELGDRLGQPSGGVTGPERGTPDPVVPDWREQVVAALTGLGWSTRQAEEAVDAVATDVAAAAADSGDVPTVLRATLRHLGRAG
jgi:Holliday junction DNA helicase RuvA